MTQEINKKISKNDLIKDSGICTFNKNNSSMK